MSVSGRAEPSLTPTAWRFAVPVERRPLSTTSISEGRAATLDFAGISFGTTENPRSFLMRPLPAPRPIQSWAQRGLPIPRGTVQPVGCRCATTEKQPATQAQAARPEYAGSGGHNVRVCFALLPRGAPVRVPVPVAKCGLAVVVNYMAQLFFIL